MKITSPFILMVLLAFGMIACQNKNSQKEAPSPTAKVIADVNIIDIRNGHITKGHVVVDSGKIQRILPVSEDEAEVIQEAELINGKGKYLVPGIAEMHAHLPSVIWNDPQMEEVLFLYLSNGITTIRGMLGHHLHLELKEKVANDKILSPRIYTSSPSLNGNTVTSTEQATEMVTSYQKDGFDFLKLHPGLRLHVFDQIVKTANEVNIPFAGHVSTLVGIRHALESGYASIDHVDGFLEGLVPESAGVNPTENGFFGYNFTEKADTTLIPDLVKTTKTHEVWVVPTQSLFSRWFSPTPAKQLANDPEMKYMAPEVIENWINSKNNLTETDAYNAEQWEDFMAIRKMLIRGLQENGHGLLLGSDAPQVFNVPGFSIQHEMQAMVEAGLSPLETLQMGTVNPAKYFGQEGNFGEIATGASADLILLDANPLEDISNMQRPRGVMVRGHWISRDQIDQKLKTIADKYRELNE
ncbi:amidohydrolase [Echinicola strongylocentroti]|uniref:Amidohydrolase n=1 Tax=Echinicola strongylocentroti TaxID=1795355 RepID=A0A2Z4IF50_9BACT|nr:amidohydrolase family protein [Echinicola strongylocentroti]AWW29330.1 amidohydrolase [Echinicola strongylocentroti]